MKLNQHFSRIWHRQLAQEVDQTSIHNFGIPQLDLMEEAGACIAQEVLKCAETFNPDLLLTIAGPGNNGGDALAAARMIAKCLPQQLVVAVGHVPGRTSAGCQHQWRLLPTSLEKASYGPNLFDSIKGQRVLIVDGLLGLGVSSKLKEGVFQEVLTELSKLPTKYVVAVDLPSGSNADDWGNVPLLPADLTITFGAAKPCHLVSPTRDACGKVKVHSLGFSADAIKSLTDSDPNPRMYLAERFQDNPFDFLPDSAHKYDRGHVLVIGGSKGKLGAPVMSGLAAMRTGSGWASVALPSHNLKLNAEMPLTLTFEDFFFDGTLDANLLTNFLYDRHVKSVLVGPGTMQQVLSLSVLESLNAWQKETRGALTIDAGCTQGILDLLTEFVWRPERTLLLPHPGEWRKIDKGSLPKYIDCYKTAQEVVKILNSKVTTVYKSATPIVFTEKKSIVITNQGNRWLGKAGTGDVVAGCCAAFLCLNISAAEAFLRAMQFVSDAAMSCANTRSGNSIIATDLIEYLGTPPYKIGAS